MCRFSVRSATLCICLFVLYSPAYGQNIPVPIVAPAGAAFTGNQVQYEGPGSPSYAMAEITYSSVPSGEAYFYPGGAQIDPADRPAFAFVRCLAPSVSSSLADRSHDLQHRIYLSWNCLRRLLAEEHTPAPDSDEDFPWHSGDPFTVRKRLQLNLIGEHCPSVTEFKAWRKDLCGSAKDSAIKEAKAFCRAEQSILDIWWPWQHIDIQSFAWELNTQRAVTFTTGSEPSSGLESVPGCWLGCDVELYGKCVKL